VTQTLPSILITIDVEDWFQVENLRPWFPPSSWASCELRAEKNNPPVARPFDRQSIKATFFILGWIAERLPDLVREIAKQGHEVASHGYGHFMCDQVSEKELKDDLVKSKTLLEKILGSEIQGYRAPNFSIHDRALNLVQECGYQYDSSYNNFNRHGRYGKITLHENQKQGIAYAFENHFYELPVSNLNFGQAIIPWGGGGYFRLLPPWLYKAGLRHSLKQNNAFVFYMHPWEIDPGQPRVKNVSGLNGWKHYLNLDKTYDRLEDLIQSFRHCEFITCSQYLSKTVIETVENRLKQ